MDDGDRYRVVAARYGTRSATRSEVFLNHAVYGVPDGPIGMDYYIWIVLGAAGPILVDTGFSDRAGRARGRTMVTRPADIYSELGVDPALAPPVIITHAHYDHLGNLSLFPQSPVFIARREYEFWTGPFAKRAQFHHSVEDDEIAELVRAHADGRVTLVDDREVIAPGVEFVVLGGHTPGQGIVLVETADGRVVLGSDAVHYYEELELDIPFAHVADLVAMYRGFDVLRGMLADGSARHLVAGHDPRVLLSFPHVSGALAADAVTIGGAL